MVALVYDLDCENQKIEELTYDQEVSCRKMEAQASRVAEEEEEVFLQTRTVSLRRCGSLYTFGFHPFRRRLTTSITTMPSSELMRTLPTRSWKRPERMVRGQS